ncbi:putative neprosin [Medicago truncatula]|uniref:Putative neprosin n=1 Tax=Medicago truncatula TaxID=3880 RepID=A0A396J9V8_MEDTR|nr:putative neprosin [Medicago truncatula]
MIYHGAYAGIVGYDLSVQAKQYSMSYIWIESGSGTQLNSIKVGVGADGFKRTGCYNANCPGFVQVNNNKEYTLGTVMRPTNSIGSTEKVASFIKIKQVNLQLLSIH